jgi:hypothetical protein
MLQLNYCRVVICSSLSPCVLILFCQFLFNIKGRKLYYTCCNCIMVCVVISDCYVFCRCYMLITCNMVFVSIHLRSLDVLFWTV